MTADNNTFSAPVFFVATQSEREAIEGAGYKAWVCGGLSADKLADLAAQVFLDDTTAIVVLDRMASLQVHKACRIVRARCRDAYEDDARAALSGEMDIAAFCEHEVSEAIRNREIDRKKANEILLESLGVHDTCTSVDEMRMGKADREKVSTGLPTLDEAIGGGLPSGGLTTLGALSSLGKTTLCGQIGDNVAGAGRHVLFVTLEQSRYELHAMSIARFMRTLSYGSCRVSRADIQSAIKRDDWDASTKDYYEKAIMKYQTGLGQYVHIMETDEQPTAKDIRIAAEAIADVYGQSPFCIVDYLQLLKPENDRRDERLAINDSISTLRKLARDLETCVLLISALNRNSMSEGVTQSAFRESSGIEYSSDLMLGLQPYEMGKKLQQASAKEQRKTAIGIIDEYRDARDKICEIRVLKNRAGIVPKDGIPLAFDGKCSYFYAYGGFKAVGATTDRTSHKSGLQPFK